MMARQSASHWPIRQVQTLADLQDGRPAIRSPLFTRSPHFKKQPGGQPVRPILRSRHPLSRLGSVKLRYRTIDSTSCEIVSNVVTVFEFASNARCATIRLENSVEILTFDCSSAPSSSVPRPPAPATPTVASPDAAVVVKLLSPEAVSPAVLATVATASCPIVEVRPLLNCAVITPAESTTKLWYTPLENPSWLFAVLLEAEASCEIVGVPLLLFRFQLKLRSLAPSANPGNVIGFVTELPDAKIRPHHLVGPGSYPWSLHPP